MPTGDHPIDLICSAEAGEITHQIFNNPDEYLGKRVGISSDKLSVAQMRDAFAKVFPDKKFGLGKVIFLRNQSIGIHFIFVLQLNLLIYTALL